MGITAFGLHFIRQVGWAADLHLVCAAFVTWIILTSRKERARITALVMVFIVVIFFWMSFHQNGLTLTLFARDYTVKQVGPFTNLFFTLPSMLAVIGSIAGIVILFYKNTEAKNRLIGGVLFLVSFWLAAFYLTGLTSLRCSE
jgi:POT family proton-dependent oligopeptide transporter